MEIERYCEKCKTHGYWLGEHDCPPWLAFLVQRQKEKETLKESPLDH